MTRNKIVHLLWFPLIIYLVNLLAKLAWFDSLTSFANDSVHYLVMARHFSPWIEESAAIASAWPLQDFPPFFPWLLAFTGAAHSYLFAHILVATIGLVSLYFYYLLSCRWLNNTSLAILPVMIFALSPGFILGLQGILSESLYLMLILVFLLVYFPTEKYSRNKIILFSLLLAAILLTRTVGITLCLAILAQASVSSILKKKIQFQSYTIAILSLGIYFSAMWIWGPEKDSHYWDILIPYIFGNGVSATGTGYIYQFSLASHLTSILYFWRSFWVIFWSNEYSVSYIIIMFFFLASLSGLILRLFKNKYDAWYVLFYILILFIWPLSGQMSRLLFPVIPLLLAYAGYAMVKLLLPGGLHLKNKLVPVTMYLFLLATILPSHFFLHAREKMADQLNMVPVYEIFHTEDPAVARRYLLLENQMLRDFNKVSNTVLPDKNIMYFSPSYLAVLSDRTGVRAPSPVTMKEYTDIALENDANYILLTRLHPRNSGLNYNGLSGWDQLHKWTKLIWCSKPINDDIATCLYKIQTTSDVSLHSYNRVK